MKSQKYTIYLDDDTFANLKRISTDKKLSKSAMLRILINEEFFDIYHTSSARRTWSVGHAG